MKKSISLLALAAVVAFGAVSCSKTTDAPEEGAAQLTITCEYPKAEGRAAASTAKPVTSWIKNIKSLTLFLTDASGTIKYVLPANLPTDADIAQKTIATANNLVQDTYNVYLIANAAATVTTSPHGTVGTNPSLALTSLLGQNISALNFGTVAATGLPDGISAAYQEPTEIFWAKQAVTVGSAPATANLQLVRAVSLLRVRINKDFTDASYPVAVNAGVAFNNATASLVLRKTSGANILASTGAVGGTSGGSLFSKKAFKIADPVAADYNPVNMGLGTGNDFSCWNDYLILPGGTNDVNTGFNIVITGLAPTGYIPRDTQGAELPALTAPTAVFWVAGVAGVAEANKILELNITLKSNGMTGTIPPPATYGDLTINASLIDWGAITSVNIDV